ncbi:MAG: transglutaminase domain-containing protein [Clostridia bacterium]|nr:transglutaminase domain-containing protein [Clostridia bacterium]
MKETLSLFLATVIILTLSIRSFKTVKALQPETKTTTATESHATSSKENKIKEKNASSKEETADNNTESKAEETTSETSSESEVSETQSSEAQPQNQATQTAPAQTATQSPSIPSFNSYANNMTSAERLNSFTLNPQYTPYTELNNKINEILNSIITPGMSNYQKIKACYAYIINTCSDGYITGQYSYRFGGWNIYAQAMALFTEHRGMCDCYSAGFTVLARAVGLNCSQHTGKLIYASGYVDDHDWVEANINGNIYVFDPDVEEDLTHSATEQRFCKTYSELYPEYTR